jgi:hypothetical protein
MASLITSTKTVKELLESNDYFNLEDPCVDFFIERYGDVSARDSSLVNYLNSDFINLDMCYYKDLIDFYKANEESILGWVDKICYVYGYSSRFELISGENIETPDLMACALVNQAMTYLGIEIFNQVRELSE